MLVEWSRVIPLEISEAIGTSSSRVTPEEFKGVLLGPSVVKKAYLLSKVAVGPVAPVGPVGPVTPVGPVAPVGPWGPGGHIQLELQGL